MSGLNAGPLLPPALCRDRAIDAHFLTYSLWPVDTVIAKERLLLWCSRTRPTGAKFRTILPLLETPKRVILPVTTLGIGWGLAKEK